MLTPFRIALSLAALSMVAVFVMGRSPSARAGSVVEHDFIGADRCRACHVEEYRMWAEGPHARALAVLDEKERKDPRCLSCHTMVPGEVSAEFAGVQCETCHGPGRYYASAHIMRDTTLRSMLLFDNPNEQTCLRCHTTDAPSIAPFVYNDMRGRIRHWPDPTAGSTTEPSGN